MFMRVKTEKFVGTKENSKLWVEKLKEIARKGKMSKASVVEVKDNKTVTMYTFRGKGPSGQGCKVYLYQKVWRTKTRIKYHGTLVQWYVYAPADVVQMWFQGMGIEELSMQEARRASGAVTREEFLEENPEIAEDEVLTDEQLMEAARLAEEAAAKREAELQEARLAAVDKGIDQRRREKELEHQVFNSLWYKAHAAFNTAAQVEEMYDEAWVEFIRVYQIPEDQQHLYTLHSYSKGYKCIYYSFIRIGEQQHREVYISL